MNISINTTSTIAQNTGSDAIGIAVLKKAMDAETQTAQALINAIPQPVSSANLPPNLGQNINTTA